MAVGVGSVGRGRQPRMMWRSSAVALRRRRKMATTMPEAHHHLGGRHHQDEEHERLAPDVVEHAGEGDEGEVGGVEHQLDAHEHHEHVAPHEQARGRRWRTARPPGPGTTPRRCSCAHLLVRRSAADAGGRLRLGQRVAGSDSVPSPTAVDAGVGARSSPSGRRLSSRRPAPTAAGAGPGPPRPPRR